MRLRHAIDPVVVFFGQGAGAKRGRDDLFEPCQVIGSVRERGARPRKGLFTECAHACESRLGILTLAAQALRDDGDELRRVVSPRRAREIEGLLANVTVMKMKLKYLILLTVMAASVLRVFAAEEPMIVMALLKTPASTLSKLSTLTPSPVVWSVPAVTERLIDVMLPAVAKVSVSVPAPPSIEVSAPR